MFKKIVGIFSATAFCLMVFGCFSLIHPYHVAVTTVNYTKKSSQMDIGIKVFFHDLEPAVNKFGGVDIDIKNHDKSSFRDSLVYAYLDKHFTIKSNDSIIDISKNGINFKDEYIFIKYTVKNIIPGKMKIENTICYEVEKTQTNLFQFKNGDNKQAKKIVNPDAVVEWEF